MIMMLSLLFLILFLILNDIFDDLFKDKENIVLTGMPASGKSTVGKLLAEKLGRSFVDISVRIYGAKSAKSVNLFVPFVIEENEITDLSYMLANESALRALFNTNGRVNSEKTKYTSELRYDNRTVSLINLTDDFTQVKKVSYGTVIKINLEFIKECITSDQAYMIFRIPHKTLDKIFESTINVVGIFNKIKLLFEKSCFEYKWNYI